jgi:hypothetical protein
MQGGILMNGTPMQYDLPPPAQQSFYAGYVPPQDAGNFEEGILQFQINCEEIIDELEHKLRGEVLSIDEKTGSQKWIRRDKASPLINDAGISKISTILRAHLTKVFILSDIEDAQIINFTESIGENLIDELFLNWEEYEIPSISTASIIIDMVTHTVFATFRKGYLGRYIDFLKTTQRIQEMQTFFPDGRGLRPGMNYPDNHGPLAWFNPFRKK